jgi:hypothetical protein
MQDDEPKSAYELAMERLRKKDADEGIDEQPLTAEQRDAIAEARKVCKAKLAELEILFKSKIAGIEDPQAREVFEEQYRRDVQRSADERDRKIAKIRARQ